MMYKSMSSRSRHNPLKEDDPMRCQIARTTLKQALSYRFRLTDIHKYSQRLKFTDKDWKFKLSALGKVIPEVPERKKIL